MQPPERADVEAATDGVRSWGGQSFWWIHPCDRIPAVDAPDSVRDLHRSHAHARAGACTRLHVRVCAFSSLFVFFLPPLPLCQPAAREKFLIIAESRGFFTPLFRAALEPIPFAGFPDRADLNNLAQALSERRLELAVPNPIEYPEFPAARGADYKDSVLHSWDTVSIEEYADSKKLDDVRVSCGVCIAHIACHRHLVFHAGGHWA